MRYVLALLGVAAALVLVVVLVGWSLPARHTASRSVGLHAAPAAVFALVADVGEYPRWRTGVTRVEVLSADGGGRPIRFREHGADGAILYEVVEREPDRRMVVRIADPTLPFGGRWTYDITPTPGGATLRITEDGEVRNPVFRFVSRFVLGHTRTMDQYLRDLSARLDGAAATSPGSRRRMHGLR